MPSKKRKDIEIALTKIFKKSGPFEQAQTDGKRFQHVLAFMNIDNRFIFRRTLVDGKFFEKIWNVSFGKKCVKPC